MVLPSDQIFRETPSPSPDPIEEPSAVPTEAAPVVTPEVTQDPVDRAVYEGDVSDTYLAKLSSYYNSHAKVNTPYVICRPSQYRYLLVYGDTNDYQRFSNATVVEIELTGSYYTNSVVEVTDGVTYTVDTTGNTAFVYSSSSDFLPSRYINSDVKTTPVFLYLLFVLVFVYTLYKFIFKLVKG